MKRIIVAGKSLVPQFTKRWMHSSKTTPRLLAMLLVFMSAGCKEEVTQPLVGSLRTAVEFVGVTEAFIRVRATVNDAPWILLVTRDSSTIFMSQPLSQVSCDTLIHDIYLRPSRNYVYKAYYLFNLTVVDSSAPLSITTMDASSNAYTWKLYQIGDGPTNGFHDVAIINDTSIWAVGTISKYDTALAAMTMYNAARFNGTDWKLYKIPVRLQYIDTALITDQDHIYSVFKAAEHDIWFISGAGGVTRLRDTSLEMMHIPFNKGPGGVSRVWGTGPQDVYFAGMGGRLVHFDGSNWQPLSSGTSLPFQDIWGTTDSATGVAEIFAVASSPFQSPDRKILKISGETVIPYSDLGIHSPLMGVWFVPGIKYYAVGDSIFTKSYPVTDTGAWALENPYRYFQECIRGIALNDAVIAGGLGALIHFDGLGWRSHYYYTQLAAGNYYRVAMTDHLIVAVGNNHSWAVMAIGRR